MKETIQSHTALPRVQRDVKSMQLRWKASRTDDVKSPTHEELLKLLPDRETADRHVHLYFQTVETTYRILHYQSFYKEYEALWEQPQQVNSGIVVILLLVMASVSCLIAHKQPKYIGDSSMSREQAIFWIEVAEKWLARQSQKHLHLAIWQIRCLIILAKQINVVKKKRIWTEAGTLVREGMSAGFHRDPRLLGEKVSFFDQEMRRRLWATIIELELQASIDRGMPSASAGIPSDTATVLNINDKDLEESDRPTSRPIKEYTSTSFLHLSTSSFSLRVSLNSLINDLSSPLLYENVLKYEDMITKELEKLGAASGVQQAQRDGNSLIANALLDIQLRQFLIMLHAPFARQAETNSRFALSRMICLDAAAEILKQYTELNRNGDFSLLLLRNDYFRAALVICQTTFVNLTINSKFPTYRTHYRANHLMKQFLLTKEPYSQPCSKLEQHNIHSIFGGCSCPVRAENHTAWNRLYLLLVYLSCLCIPSMYVGPSRVFKGKRRGHQPSYEAILPCTSMARRYPQS